MQVLDWIVLIGTLAFIIIYGSFRTRRQSNVKDYLRGGNEARWWTVGLSVMATQASAITFLSTPGQAYDSGMGFVQFYFGLPIAIIIICLVFIPIYHKLNVYTAYEYLESRFDRKTRTLTALIFLIQRGLSAGITIFAPSIVLSAVLGWDLKTLNILIGSLVILYTMIGGTKAVNVTQKQQMFVIMTGMLVAFCLILNYLPEDMSLTKALELAGAQGKMEILDFSLDPKKRYTIWTGLTGGVFLMLSYFGTDQSQVQRYLSGKSLKEMRLGLLFNGLLKVPMQFFILLTGVMVFVFYQFNSTPLNFNPAATEAVMDSDHAGAYEELANRLRLLEARKFELSTSYISEEIGSPSSKVEKKAMELGLNQLQAEERLLREEAKYLIAQADEEVETNDRDYIFIHFILSKLPMGLVGLLLAVILSAAMSSTSSELNALATTTTIDLYRPHHFNSRSEEHYVKATRYFTLCWGLLAIGFASIASLFDNLIQLVNIIGSIFYGTVLGVFLLAFFIKKVNGKAAFWGALLMQLLVIGIYVIGIHQKDEEQAWFGYLMLNFIGCVGTMLLAFVIQTLNQRPFKMT